MLVDFKYIVASYGVPKGIIHIGAHLMEERNAYRSYGLNNTVWIEANESKYKSIKTQIIDTDEVALHYVVSDEDDKEVNFNITNNGESSSILDLEKHLIHHPHIHVIDKKIVKTTRMDTIINRNNIDLIKYNFINLDIQGAELLALKGFGDLLKNFQYIYTEINTAHLYKDCALLDDLDSYLSSFSFSRKETLMTDYEWGDAFYVNENF